MELAFKLEARATSILSVYFISGDVHRPLEYSSLRVKHGSSLIPVVLRGDNRSRRAYGAFGFHVVVWAPIAVDRGPAVLGQLEFVYKGRQKNPLLSRAQPAPWR